MTVLCIYDVHEYQSREGQVWRPQINDREALGPSNHMVKVLFHFSSL